MKRSAKVIGLILCMFLSFVLCGNRVNAGSAQKVIRVGYPIQEGLTEKNEDGTYSGYTYEYLVMLEQYTGIKYEFIEVKGDTQTQKEKCLDMLEKGEIDLLGGMPYSEEVAEKCDYVMNNYGTYGLAIYVSADNHTLTTTSVYAADSIRIAVCKEEKQEETKALKKFVKEHKLNVQLVDVGSPAEQLKALEAGKADALLANTLDRPSKELRSIRQFDTEPFYFVAPKGEERLVSIINTAIAENQENDPAYEINLNEKYFSNPPQIIDLTEDEQTYVQSLDKVTVASLGQNAPINYTDEDGNARGYGKDVLEYISEKSGLKYEMSVQNDMENFKSLVQSGEPELIICRADMQIALRNSGYYVSRKCLSIPISLVINTNIDADNLEGKKQAVPYLAESISDTDFHGSPEACLKAINSGKADYGYINSYATDYYTRLNRLQNLYVYLQSEEHNESLVIAVREDVSDQLLPVVNKLLHNFEEENMAEDCLYKNIVNSADLSLIHYIRHNLREVGLIVVAMLSLMLLFMLAYRYYLEKRSKEYIIQQSQIDSLTGCVERYTFLEEATKALEKAGEDFSILYMMIDVDKFKQINDTYGHVIGDKVLKEIAGILMDTFHEEDIVGRIGGDEFAILVQNQETIEHIDEVMRRLFEKLKLIILDGENGIVGISVGGIKAEKPMSSTYAYEAADRTMYQVKKNGGNTWDII